MFSGTIANNDPLERLPVVLIIEDELVQRVALADYLQEAGFNVVEAATVDAGFEIVRRGEVPVDIVVTDVRTAGRLDGFMLARWIRTNYPHLPVIVISGHANDAELTEILRTGEAFFLKPFDERKLLAKIRQLLVDGSHAPGGN
jgi:DNA-binding response OmpR family regulator